jgi:hypothetical protein
VQQVSSDTDKPMEFPNWPHDGCGWMKKMIVVSANISSNAREGSILQIRDLGGER